MANFHEIGWEPKWFSSGGTLKFSLEWQLDNVTQINLLNSLLECLLIFEQETIIDCRGRGSTQILLEGPAIAGSEYELFYAKGVLSSFCEDDSDENFEYKLRSTFDSFEPVNHIKHRIEKLSNQASLTELLPKDLSYFAGVRVDFFRIGLCLYRPARAGLFGVSPEVKEELLIDCDGRQLKLSIVSRDLKRKQELPLQPFGILNVLNQTLLQHFQVDLKSKIAEL